MSPTATTPNPQEALVTAADIARLADVRRAAVSNWRRRHPDFPAPIAGTAASPLFSLTAVETWFAERGRPFDVSPMDRLWQRAQGAVEHIRLAKLVGLLGLVLVALQRHPDKFPTSDEKLVTTLQSSLPELEGTPALSIDPVWTDIVRATTELARQTGTKPLFTYLSRRFFETHSRRLTVPHSDIAQVMNTLARVSHGSTVLDPACGTGGLLIAAQEQGANSLHGQTTDPDLGHIALARLLLAGATAKVTTANPLRRDPEPDLLADAVLSDPPFHDQSWRQENEADEDRWEYGLPPRAEPELAWAQHCLGHVEPGGNVVMTMPPAAAGRRSGVRIRRNLVRSGALRAVINLPSRTAAAAPDLWVLRRPDADDASSTVLFISQPPDLAAIEAAWRAFDEGTDDVGEGSSVVPIVDLIDDETDLTPARHQHQRAFDDVGPQFSKISNDLAAELSALASQLPRLSVTAGGPSMSSTTVASLIESGAITVHQAPLSMTTTEGGVDVLTAKDLRDGRPPTGATSNQPGLITVMNGDVVLSMSSREQDVYVIVDDGAALGPQLLLLRPAPDRIDSQFLAGFLRIARTDPTKARRSHRFDLHSAAVPVLSLADQRHYGAAFHQLNSLKHGLRRVTELTSMLDRSALTGLGNGYLTPVKT